MNRIVLFGTASAPIDVEALRRGLGRPAEFITAPASCLVKPLTRFAEEELCPVVESANAIVFRVGQVTEGLIDAARDLSVVAVHGVGTDSVDVAAASRRGVYVSVTPGTNANAAAEYVIGILLLAVRRLGESVALLKGDGWNDARIEGGELSGKSIGIVGYGAIGSRVARLTAGLDMDVTVAAHESIAGCGYPILPLPELAEVVDFLVIAVPRRATTEGLLSESILRRMRSSAFLVNIARGGIVDEASLKRVLDDGAIAGACLDVFAHEPVSPNHALVCHPRVLATPHLAGSTRESLARTAFAAGQEIRRAWDGRRPENAINEPSPRPGTAGRCP